MQPDANPEFPALNSVIAMKDRLEAYVNNIQSLPPTPSMMLKLVALFKDPDPDIDKIVGLISRDPSLTSEVLKRCNSAHFRGDQAVTDMFEAVSRVGFYELYRIVMSIAGVRAISFDNIEDTVQVETVCRHSVATAISASVIARAVNFPPDTAFLTGLLHDIGKMILASAEGRRYRTVSQFHLTHGGNLVEIEKKNFGFNHSEIGSYLLERWLLPPEIALAVHFHHHVAAGPAEFQRLAAIIALADMIANGAEKRSATDLPSLQNLDCALSTLNLPAADVTAIMSQAHDEMRRESGPLLGPKATPFPSPN